MKEQIINQKKWNFKKFSKLVVLIFLFSASITAQVIDKKQNQSYPLLFNLVWGGGSDWWQNQFHWNLTVWTDSIPVKRAQSAYGKRDSIYWSFTSDWNAGEPLNRLMTIPDQWYVRTANGSRISYWGTYLVDPTNYCPQVNGRRYNEMLADTLAVFANPTVWDGINSDGTWAYPFQNLADIDLDRNGLADYSETSHGSTPAERQAWISRTWAAGYYTLANRLRSKQGWTNKLLTYWTVKDSMGMNAFNGAGWENAPQNAPVTFDLSFPDAGVNGFNSAKQIFDTWNKVTTTSLPRMNYLSASMASEATNSNCPQPFWQHAKEWYRYMRWTLGMAMITDAYYNIQDADASSGVNDHSASFYYDEFNSNLGQPTGAPQQLPSGVWVRFFTNGAIILNTQSSTQTVTNANLQTIAGYNGPYYRLFSNQDTAWNNGSIFTSATLTTVPAVRWRQPIGDMIILKNSQDTVICPIVIDNAYAGTTPGSSQAVLTNLTWDNEANSGTALDYNPTYNVGYRGSTDTRWYRSHRTSAGSGEATAVYTPGINRAGYWRVYEWHGWAGTATNSYSEATNVPCRISYDGGYKDTTINQQMNAGRWNLLGTFPYSPGGNKSLTITNNANGVVIADAFKWEFVASNGLPNQTIQIPQSPTPTNPLNGTTGIDLTTTLTWNTVANATRYHLQVATDSSFTTLVVNDSILTTNSRQLQSLEYQKTYYWHVSAINQYGRSMYSNIFRFTTMAQSLSVPLLTSPSNGILNSDLTTSLAWDTVSGATLYHLQVATDSVFTALIVNDSSLSVNSRQLQSLEYQKTYYWHVSAKNQTLSGSYSNLSRFTVRSQVLLIGRSSIDFGNVAIGKTKVDSVMVKNPESRSVSILKISQALSQFSVLPQSFTLAPNESLKVRVVFAPTEKLSYSSMTKFDIIADSISVATMPLKGSGIRPPKIRRTPAAMTIVVSPNVPEKDTLIVYNDGDQDLVISSAYSTNSAINISPNINTIAPADSQQFVVTTLSESVKVDSGYIILVNNSELSVDSTRIKITVINGVKNKITMPANFGMLQNYPNPFNPVTNIIYNLPVAAKVRVNIFNAIGQEVKNLVDETEEMGIRSLQWDATDDNRNSVSSGIYYCRIEAIPSAGGSMPFVQTKKMILLK